MYAVLPLGTTVRSLQRLAPVASPPAKVLYGGQVGAGNPCGDTKLPAPPRASSRQDGTMAIFKKSVTDVPIWHI